MQYVKSVATCCMRHIQLYALNPAILVSAVDYIPQIAMLFVLIVNGFCSMSLAENKPFRRNLDAYITRFNEVSNELFL